MGSLHVLSLQGVPGWPTIFGLGCATYQFNSSHVLLLPFDVRSRIDMSTAQEFWSRRLFARLRTPMPAACQGAHLNLSATHCILRSLALSAATFSLMTEAPFHYRLKEIAHRSGGLKLGGPSGQLGHDTDTGQVVFVDTDHMYEVDSPASTAVEQAAPGHSAQDLVFDFSSSVLVPVAVHILNNSIPQLGDLVKEIEERHTIITVGLPLGQNTVQLAFSCVVAWLRAVATSIAPPAGTSGWPIEGDNNDSFAIGRAMPLSIEEQRPQRMQPPGILSVVESRRA